MSRLTIFGFLLCLVALPDSLLLAADAPADWPQWRGPRRDGVSTDTGLLKAWPKDGPKLLWETKGAGRGYSSLAITGGKIFTMGDGPTINGDKDEYLVCFDEPTGKSLWKAKIGPPWTEGAEDWQSSRSTPTVDGELVFVLTAAGDVVCLETAGGKERWRKSLKKDFAGRKGDGWGYSESVLIDSDKLLCTPGGDKNTMVALNKNTGATLWTAAVPEDRGAGHASIVPSDVGQTRVYVQTTASGALGVRASDGKVLWTYPIDRTTAVIPTPIVRDDLAFFSVGYGRGGALLRQVAGSDGDVGVEAAYPGKKERKTVRLLGVPVAVEVADPYPLKRALNNKHGGIVLVGKYLYGDTDSGGKPFCAELSTGTVQWNKGGSGRGSAAIAAADGHLYIRYANGVMVLAEASPNDYKELGSFKVPHSGSRPSWAHPAITGGKMYLREGDFILCYELRDN